MHSGKNGIWIAAFIALLMVNLAVVVTTNAAARRQDETLPYDDQLLSATDEVQLAWWPAMISPPTGVMLTQSPRSTRLGRQYTGGIIGEEPVQIPDYPELMTGYISVLERYLTEYFHITPHRLVVVE